VVIKLRLGQGPGVMLAAVMAVGGCATTPTTPTAPTATVAASIVGSHQNLPIQDCFKKAARADAIAETNERTLQPAPGNYNLRCGDRITGIIHINNDHPMQTNTDDFLRCVAVTILYGDPTAGNPPGTTVFAAFYEGVNATSYVLVDDRSRDVLTAYTNKGTQGNDWPGCVGK